MDISPDLLERASRWDGLKRWERRELAQDLRRLGLSYREIAAVIPVSKSSLSAWCRDVPLSPDQHARLSTIRPTLESRVRLGERKHAEAVERRAKIRDIARLQASGLMGDSLWTAGVAAYWAEGAKKQDVPSRTRIRV